VKEVGNPKTENSGWAATRGARQPKEKFGKCGTHGPSSSVCAITYPTVERKSKLPWAPGPVPTTVRTALSRSLPNRALDFRKTRDAMFGLQIVGIEVS